jgi:hypothetical protein
MNAVISMGVVKMLQNGLAESFDQIVIVAAAAFLARN